MADLTKSFIEHNLLVNDVENCVHEDRVNLKGLFGYLNHFLQIKSKISEKQYLAATDPKILKKVTDKTTEIDSCVIWFYSSQIS